MRLLGWEITRTNKAAVSPVNNGVPYGLPPEGTGRGWFPVIRELFPGSWQRNVHLRQDNVLSHWAVWACVMLIAGDIGKLRIRVIQQQDSGIWSEETNSAYTPVLRDPNPYQNPNQFFESWVLSKLLHGNTYVLKQRDGNGLVRQLYILDVAKVRPLVAPDGSVFYELSPDYLSGINEPVTVPAREVIHDRWNTVFHPLIGVSPLFAAVHGAIQGLRIQTQSTAFFDNQAAPRGILVAPESIDTATAERLEQVFAENYGGANVGRIAVVGDNLKFQQIGMSSVDSQLLEQLRLTAEMVATIFNIPQYKVNLGPLPPGTGIEPLNMEYYQQALQKHIEHIETCLDRGLSLPANVGVEFDLDGLFRMDTATKIGALRAATEASIMAPNEARAKLDLAPVPGGDQPYMQQQYWPVGVLANRPPPAPPQPSPNEPTLSGPSAQPPEASPSTPGPLAEPADSAAGKAAILGKGRLGKLAGARIRERLFESAA